MIEAGSIVAFLIAIVIVLVIAKLVFKSTKSFFAILANAAIGAVCLWILDAIGYGVPINWITAGLVGLLGVPGVILVVILKYVLNII